MAYQVAICDDNEVDIHYLETLLAEWSSMNGVSLQLDTFPSAEAFLFQYAEKPDYDILLLDIEMAAMDGVALAREIRRSNETVQILFISGYSEYIAEGYEVAALHYLMKPVHKDKFFTVMDRALTKVRKNEKILYLEAGGEMVRIPLHEICLLEVNRNYVTIHASQDYEVRRTLAELEKELTEDFFRIGRSCIVNLNYVQKVTRNAVHLINGTQLPLPRGSYDAINRAIIARM